MSRELPPLPPPLPDGGVWCRRTEAPMPTLDEILQARRDPAERRRVDLMYAAACGFEGAAAEDFVMRLALADVRTEIAHEEEAVEALEAARRRREAAEAGGQLRRLRGNGLRRVRPERAA